MTIPQNIRQPNYFWYIRQRSGYFTLKYHYHENYRGAFWIVPFYFEGYKSQLHAEFSIIPKPCSGCHALLQNQTLIKLKMNTYVQISQNPEAWDQAVNEIAEIYGRTSHPKFSTVFKYLFKNSKNVETWLKHLSSLPFSFVGLVQQRELYKVRSFLKV